MSKLMNIIKLPYEIQEGPVQKLAFAVLKEEMRI